MTTLAIKDGSGALFYLDGTGAGTLGSPFIPTHTLNLGSLAAGSATIGGVNIISWPALAAGSALIGGVNVITMSALVTSTATIGSVHQATYGTPTASTVTTAVTATQFSSVACKYARFTAREGNAANVSYGGSGVTTAAGRELGPGATSGWIPVSNTNLYYYIGANTSDKIDVETLN